MPLKIEHEAANFFFTIRRRIVQEESMDKATVHLILNI